MGEPCKQEGAIGALGATVDAVKETLEKLSEGQEKFLAILEKIAAQGEKITHLEQGHDILFERVRQVELKATEERVRVGGIAAVVSMVIGSVASWVVKEVLNK